MQSGVPHRGVKDVLRSFIQNDRPPSNHSSRLTLGDDNNKLPPLTKKKRVSRQRPTMFTLTRWSKKKFRKRRTKLDPQSRANKYHQVTRTQSRFSANISKQSGNVISGRIEPPDVWSRANLKALNSLTKRIYGDDKSKAMASAYFRVSSPITIETRCTAANDTARRRTKSFNSQLRESSTAEWCPSILNDTATASMQPRTRTVPRKRTTNRLKKRDRARTESAVDLISFDRDEELIGW